MKSQAPRPAWWTWAAGGLVGTVALRLLTLGRVPLTDNTESRYATIGWEMARSGDWVTPRLYSQGELVPFWGKPPLQFWLTGLSFRAGGASEIAARMPSFLLGIGVLAATVLLARALWGRRVAALAGLILGSSGLFFLLAGACALDMPLTACVTAALVAFARAVTGAPRRAAWGHAFFLALAAGMLAKGPVALALVATVVLAWLALTRSWPALRRLPWLTGLPLFAVAAAPWYVLAERATPGFLRYFLLNEHLLRYLRHDYGDRYGSGHAQPYGTSWPMLAVAFLPWTALGAAALWRLWRQRPRRGAGDGPPPGAPGGADPWLAFAVAWGLAPAAFFTVTPQLLIAYMAPGLPGLALATAVGLERWREAGGPGRLDRWLVAHVLALAAVLAGGAVVATRSGAGLARADLALAAATVAAAIALAAVAVARFRRRDLDALLALVAIAGATGLGLGTCLVAPSVGERHSARQVLAAAYRDDSLRGAPLAMPFGEDSSALWYGEAVHGASFDHQPPGREARVRDLLATGRREVLLFQRQHWEKLEPGLAARLSVVAGTPHWVAATVGPARDVADADSSGARPTAAGGHGG